jgi:hypothetical protein
VNCSIAICKQLPGKYVFSNSAPNQVYYMLFRFGLYTSIRGFHGSAWRNFINRNLHAADDGGGRLFLPARLAARRRTSVLHSASRVGDRGFAFAVRLRDATTVKMLKSVLSPEKVKVSAASAHGSLAGGMRRVEEQVCCLTAPSSSRFSLCGILSLSSNSGCSEDAYGRIDHARQ